MDKKDEKALEEKSKIQKDAEGTLPGRQFGLYSKVDKKEVRNMVSEINPDKNSLGSRGYESSALNLHYLCKTLAFQLYCNV